MKNLLSFFLLVTLFASCGGECEMKGQLDAVSAELEATKSELAALKSAPATEGRVLIHTVFFKTKPDLTETEMADLISKLESLETVETAEEVWVGKPADTGDPRLVSDYQVAIQLTFSSEENLSEYQTDPHHVKMREESMKYLAAPPVVYDFWAE